MHKKSISSLAYKNRQKTFNNKEKNNKLQASKPCDRCRKHRIKCNRSLLGCTHCAKNSIICEYKYIPKKRGPKSKLERDCDYLKDVNKKYNESEQVCMLRSDPITFESTGDSTQFNGCKFAPIQQFSAVEQFGFESMSLSMPILNTAPPILISQYFTQNLSPQSLNFTTLNSTDTAQEFSMSISPNFQQQQDLSMPYSPKFQALNTSSSTIPQDSYIQTTNMLSPSSQDLSLSLSPELNQCIFETSTLRQEAFQIPPAALIDTYIPSSNTLDPNYWLPPNPNYFISTIRHSTDNIHLNPDHSSIIF
ncbi:hypothetical protein CONCODRAFT_80175 [Conidiobolus coronatus NRRL 28638]|uniref:Zn(2)-C6 fungal-type domain-containing protein n=1 Tax=Conidiobolus coronatus (strain ATCC 28846 / CBS 209.66 / NRRL 28638) TaxID=796925 RepID=A0A137NXI4_CONC2|nr:hypothetical protein CONCODRAFT_80175 [Conidiobolus coronatus NRRL 28638]|eukprot:KXN67384.1 hypothetical protein CONCODRAFT_80175 [Conidiobolus coronatus NRRL 28638]